MSVAVRIDRAIEHRKQQIRRAPANEACTKMAYALALRVRMYTHEIDPIQCSPKTVWKILMFPHTHAAFAQRGFAGVPKCNYL